MTRHLQRVLATTDFHSSFDNAPAMLAHLAAARPDTLIADCGDFFEGTGFYRLGGGALERSVLLSLYDVVAPGNHGWSHHFEPALRRITVCANVVDTDDRPLFAQVRLVELAGRRVAVTAVIGQDAFRAIPAGERSGHHVIDPGQALREVLLRHHHQADHWVLLSHSGFGRDLELADACPFLDVVFAGHCHAERTGPATAGHTVVVKGRELGAGYAVAEPSATSWAAWTGTFGPPLKEAPEPFGGRIHDLRRRLAEPLGPVNEPFRNSTPDRRVLLGQVAEHLRRWTGADAVLLNETCLRAAPLGDVLRLGDLLAIEPFDNELVVTAVPPGFDPTPLSAVLGPLTVAPDPFPSGSRTVLTTRYLAETHLGGDQPLAGPRLRQAVLDVLTHGVPR